MYLNILKIIFTGLVLPLVVDETGFVVEVGVSGSITGGLTGKSKDL